MAFTHLKIHQDGLHVFSQSDWNTRNCTGAQDWKSSLLRFKTKREANTSRSGLERVLDTLRKGDTLVVWRLDRLGRSLKHLLELMGELEQEKIGFRSLQESINMGTTLISAGESPRRMPTTGNRQWAGFQRHER